MDKIDPPAHPEPGVHLTLAIDRDEVTVQYFAQVRHAPRGALHAPILTPDRAATLAGPASEFVSFVLDERGSVLDQFGWPFWMDEFFDVISPEGDGNLIGSPGRSSDGARVWRVPLVEGARYLYVVRSDVTQVFERPGLVFRQHPLALFWLGPPPAPPVPPLPVPWPDAPPSTPLPTPARPVTGFPVIRTGPVPPPWGRIVDVVPILQHGPTDKRFNIVVAGDGFTEAELDAYDQRVRILFGLPDPAGPPVRGTPPNTHLPLSLPVAVSHIDLGHMEPFASVWGSINAWSVRTVSDDSGITIPGCGHAGCAHPCLKHTYYRVKGCFRGKPNPGYVGIEDSDQLQLRNAAAGAVPIEHAHLIIVIVNYPEYGGSAFPEKKLAFADMGDGTNVKKWVQMVAHECAHAIAHVAEERIVGVPKDPAEDYPNQAAIADVDGNSVRWKCLARASELGNGQFKAIHRCGDQLYPPNPFNPLDPLVGQPVMHPASLYGMLGAFWGCQNFDLGQTPDLNCDDRRDPKGANFFRPMAQCRMRAVNWAFCRVCEAVITHRITELCV